MKSNLIRSRINFQSQVAKIIPKNRRNEYEKADERALLLGKRARVE